VLFQGRQNKLKVFCVSTLAKVSRVQHTPARRSVDWVFRYTMSKIAHRLGDDGDSNNVRTKPAYVKGVSLCVTWYALWRQSSTMMLLGTFTLAPGQNHG